MKEEALFLAKISARLYRVDKRMNSVSNKSKFEALSVPCQGTDKRVLNIQEEKKVCPIFAKGVQSDQTLAKLG